MTENLDDSDPGSEDSADAAGHGRSKSDAGSSDGSDEKPKGRDDESASSNDEHIPKQVLRTLKDELRNSGKSSTFRNSQVRMVKRGLLSNKSVQRLSISGHTNEESSDEESSGNGDERADLSRSERDKQIRHASMGLMSQVS